MSCWLVGSWYTLFKNSTTSSLCSQKKSVVTHHSRFSQQRLRMMWGSQAAASRKRWENSCFILLLETRPCRQKGLSSRKLSDPTSALARVGGCGVECGREVSSNFCSDSSPCYHGAKFNNRFDYEDLLTPRRVFSCFSSTTVPEYIQQVPNWHGRPWVIHQGYKDK